MGLFLSIINQTFGWLTHKKECPMDRVAQWLRENDLEVYIQKFEEYGWDKLSVLLEMTEMDIEMCIQKPGHKAKFKRALRYLKCELDNPSVAYQTGMHERSDQEAMKAAIADVTLISADSNSSISEGDTEQPITDSLEPQQSNSVVNSDTSNAQSDSEADQEALFDDKDAVTADFQDIEEPVSTSSKDLSIEYKVDAEQPPKASDSIEHQTSDIIMESNSDNEEHLKAEPEVKDHAESEKELACNMYKEIADTKALFDYNVSGAIKEMDKSRHIAVMNRNVVSESPSIRSAVEGTSVNLTNLTIIKHSEHTVIADHTLDKSVPECESTPPLMENLQDQMLTIASSFEEKDELYVETKAYRELKTIAEDQHWATLLGKAGDGKSATAAHLLLYYQRQGYRPIFLSSVRQWESLISSKQSTKQFVVIDDMFGSIVLDGKKAGEWLTEIEKMEKIVSKRKGDLLVVCTSRRHIFKDIESKLYKCSCFRKTSIVDMTDKQYKLSDDEKFDILERYAKRYDIELDEEMVNQIETINSPHGFPHCVEMFCTNAFLRESGISFFENPEEFVQKELHNFKDNDPLKFLVLLLVLYKRNRIHLRYFEEIVENSDEEVEKLFRFTGIPLSTSYASMTKAVNALTNTYLTQTVDGYYSFTHESLKENVSNVYISLNPFHATKLLDFQQILTHMSKPTVNVKLSENELAERITIELLSGNVDSVSTCASWQDPTFVDEWIKLITMTFESSRLPSSLSKFLLRAIFFPGNDNFFPGNDNYGWRHSQDNYYAEFPYNVLNECPPKTLITSLLENKMYLATIAILNSKCIQKALGQDEKLIKCLEKWLEIVCSMAYFDIIYSIDCAKAIVASQRATHMRMLNGSGALINALNAPEPECALYVIDNTNIKFDKGYADICIQNLFKSSMYFAQFKPLCKWLVTMWTKINENRNEIHLLYDYIKIKSTNISLRKFKYLLELTKNVDASSSEIGTDIVELVVETLTAEQCLKVLPVLKERNANFQHVNKTSLNALHIICMRQNVSQYLEVLQYLVDLGVDASQESDDGVVPLMFALQNDPGIDCIKWLLSVSPHRHRNKVGQGYFHYLLRSSCSFDCLEKYCSVLLKANEDINLQDTSGTTPIMDFLQNSVHHRQDISDFRVYMFLNFLGSTELDFHLTDNDGRNVLHYTFQLPESQLTRKRQKHYKYRISPLEDNILSTIFDFLVDKVKVDCFLADKNGVNPLMIALENYTWSRSVTKFMNRDIPNQVDKDGRTYFHYLDVSRERLGQIQVDKVHYLDDSRERLDQTMTERDFSDYLDLVNHLDVSPVYYSDSDLESYSSDLSPEYNSDSDLDSYSDVSREKLGQSDLDLDVSVLVVALMNGLCRKTKH